LIIELYKKLLIICKISSCIFSQMRQGEWGQVWNLI
jgi:hypothetical protein